MPPFLAKLVAELGWTAVRVGDSRAAVIWSKCAGTAANLVWFSIGGGLTLKSADPRVGTHCDGCAKRSTSIWHTGGFETAFQNWEA